MKDLACPPQSMLHLTLSLDNLHALNDLSVPLQAHGTALQSTVRNKALLEVQAFLEDFGKTMADVGMHTPSASASEVPRAEREEMRSNEQPQALHQWLDINVPLLNADQRAVLDRASSLVQTADQLRSVRDVITWQHLLMTLLGALDALDEPAVYVVQMSHVLWNLIYPSAAAGLFCRRPWRNRQDFPLKWFAGPHSRAQWHCSPCCVLGHCSIAT